MKKISESVWSDMEDRSIGDAERKEDSIEDLDRDGLYDYVRDNYKRVAEYDFSSISEKTGTENKCLLIPLFHSKTINATIRLIAKFKDGNIVKIAMDTTEKGIEEVIDVLKKDFDVNTDPDFGTITITKKNGTVTNRAFMDIIELVTQNAEDPNLKKKEN